MKFRGSSEKLQSQEINRKTQSLKKSLQAKTGRPAQQVKNKRGNARVAHIGLRPSWEEVVTGRIWGSRVDLGSGPARRWESARSMGAGAG